MDSDRPFDDREERFFLAEILKDAPIPPTYLLACIRQMGIQPRWTEIALPYGRSVSACQRAFDRLQGTIPTGYGAPHQAEEPFSTPARIKKRTPAVAHSTPADMNPAGFSTFASVNDPATPYAPSSSAQSPSEKPQKKRGRPSKGDIEARVAEAAERGEVYQHPEPKRPRKQPPKDPTPVTMTFASGQEGDPANFRELVAETTPGSSAPKKRAPKPRASKEPKVTSEATVTAASTLGGPIETQPQPGVLETQNVMQARLGQSELAGLNEQAHLAQPKTSEERISQQPQVQQEQLLHPSPQAETETPQTVQPSLQTNAETYPSLQTSPQAESKPYQTPYQPDSAV